MAISRGFRFPIEFGKAFPQGLVLLGDIAAATKYNPNPNAAPEQMFDIDPKTGEGTGLPLWKATVTDPHEDKAKRASFEIIFISSHQPVPATQEIVPGTGMRMIELEGLTAEPRVMGQGEFKYQGYQFRATGIKGDTNTPKATNTNGAKAAA
ncbi:hypothetical protein [Nocardia cyriacigeorgica]|jgi:hypothetical protein|uniref:Uncharacterized protein n=1 Tax=Nocardia cyriacigeorgica TaxID=135487 RepID=A0A2L2JPE0_9NOCA|nr:hypothetical protein [Nocardia cyriacigeorgica]AVH21719.1 hypothetical protein C5B73_09925 [Nocardia cyriacigeorgica]MBF6092360.1 hypothetical protein [Nocardia cyriacigeorgica]MBF6162912.1 hypothetical protein [Nocardia cyriacigeorgica]MBF6201788.1 hypothetical protein [Nocardia cyriacigeorgica]MBF6315353.1 hypothetical protein [Nocardia cyriacigeorgica]